MTKARSVQPGDDIDGHGEVSWVIAPMRAGIHDLLPNGGALITFTNQTQIGLDLDAEVITAPTATEVTGMMNDKVHKATPGTDEYHCEVCGQVIRRVPGGQGPTWVHSDSGAVSAPNPPMPRD